MVRRVKNEIQAARPLNGRFVVDDPFWSPKLDTFFAVTLKDTFRKLKRDGALENYQNLIDGNLQTHRGCPWHDGLLLETIRGASDYLAAGRDDAEIRRILEECADLIRRAQLASGGGYLSTYTQLDRPEQRYGENGGSILWQHDLYNNGCLFEAGVHCYRATGQTALLACAVRSANELCDTIGLPPKKNIVPGHPLPENALLEMIELAEDEPGLADALGVPVRSADWRTLAHFWIHARGVHETRTNHPQYMGEYAQDHVPVEEQFQAVGHAVRATLYYTGCARLAMLEGDRTLLGAMRRIWDNIAQRKTHINGGVGATHFEEKFGEDYDLPNTAYLETCAAVGLIFFSRAMAEATGEARYYEAIERALYNLMLSSVTVQGDSYFYRNPLTSDGSDHHWSWHSCPCCPPMIHKTFGMFDRLAFTQSGAALRAELLVGGVATAELDKNRVRVKTTSALPWRGEWTAEVEAADEPFVLKVRVPAWGPCAFSVGGIPVDARMEGGYACFDVRQGDRIDMRVELPVRRVEAHP